jgi:branched-chain amino acid aminotransferase
MSFQLENSISYLRDSYVPFAEANLSIASSSVLYGMSIYTVFNVIYKNEELYAFRLKDHYKRLCNSAKIMGMSAFDTYISFENFEKIVSELLAKNDLKENALVRVAYFIDENAAGTKIQGLKTSMSMYVLPMKSFYGKPAIDTCISSWIRVADNMIPPRAKVNGSYANACLMKNEALQKGFDEAIAINSAGHVSEATVANLFIVKNGALFTPDINSDILEGITRNTVIEIAKKKGISCVEKKITKEELYDADEIFLSGSSANIVSVQSVDGKNIPQNTLTKEIAKIYEEVRTGENDGFIGWLTKI